VDPRFIIPSIYGYKCIYGKCPWIYGYCYSVYNEGMRMNDVVYGSVWFSLNCFSVAWFIVHELRHWHDLYIYLQFNT